MGWEQGQDLSGATLLLSRACLLLFGEYMLMSNQLYHREAETKGTRQHHESDPYPWPWRSRSPRV